MVRMAQEALMHTTHPTLLTRFSAVALIGLGSFAATACGTAAPPASAQSASLIGSAPAPSTPIAVNCGEGQQALIRSTLVGGQAVSQVDCVPIAGAVVGQAVAPRAVAAAPMVATAAPLVATLDGDPRLVSAPVYRTAARPVRYQTGEYAPVRQVKRGRSWQKSALIIGSSAGIGAGVGAGVKGKKGALIGAAVGGGAATIWDQITRRN
jgi:hypothetical protein